MTRPLILLTNDDGILSPGLAASAAALDPLGDLLIVAPAEQQSGTGRSMPKYQMIDGRLVPTIVHHEGKQWPAFAASATPALSVQHAVLELAERRVDLVVSGINYGENVGTGITISGTVGAALEGASFGIPALAVSRQVDTHLHLSYDEGIDWSAAIYFTRFFAERWLHTVTPQDVDVLKLDIPESATEDTEWVVTHVERKPYFIPLPPERKDGLMGVGRLRYDVGPRDFSDPNTDAAAVQRGVVSVTPISLDMTSRTEPDVLKQLIHSADGQDFPIN